MALALAVAFAAAPALAAEPSTQLPPTSPATTPLSVQFDALSKITGRTYRIYVARPFAPPPKGGYPVIYVMDGDFMWATAAAQARLANLSGGRPALVVGVAYPNVMETQTARAFDLTPSTPDAAAMKVAQLTGKPEDYGHAEAFHRFLTEELRPLIAGNFQTDPKDQSLIGYSLGGLFALHV
ncbi:MAG: alpha/beta hydrolase-fold protein, partial [Phenylobacterium sp.]